MQIIVWIMLKMRNSIPKYLVGSKVLHIFAV